MGCNSDDGHCVLKSTKKMSVLSYTFLTWLERCRKGMIDRGFQSSTIDPCLFHKWSIVIVLCVDDACMFGAYKEKIKSLLKSLKRADSKAKHYYPFHDGGFDFTVSEWINKILGVEAHKRENNVVLIQPFMIARIIAAVGFEKKLLIKNIHLRSEHSTKMNISKREITGRIIVI